MHLGEAEQIKFNKFLDCRNWVFNKLMFSAKGEQYTEFSTGT